MGNLVTFNEASTLEESGVIIYQFLGIILQYLVTVSLLYK